jgi:hypothetical protein
MMRDGFPCFLILVAIAIVMLVAWYNRARSRDSQQAFQAVARWFHGRLEKRGWLTTPAVRIPYNHADIDVTIGVGDNGRKCTQATVEWEEFNTAIRIYSNQFGLRPFSKRGGLRMGDAEWDRAFTVEAEDYQVARTVLTGGVRSAIIMLSRIRRAGGLDIRFGQGELLVQKLMVLDQASELSAFVRHVMELFDQALLSRTTGIEFVDHVEAQVIEDAKCPICGDLIEDDLVFCSRCKTPHHRECWNYNGKCATYACGELNFAAPRIAKPR